MCTNVGGGNRQYEGVVFQKAKKAFDRPILGTGCSLHILNNTVQTVCVLPVDIEFIVVKIHKLFISAMSVTYLTKFCN